MISVIVCTCNRSQDLRKAIESFLSQKNISAIEYELIVVNNNSSDDTESVCKEFKDSLRYLVETKRGKSHALNLAIKESKGEVLVFTDDDVVFDENWLNEINIFSKENDFDAIGGRILPVYPKNAPKWVVNNLDLLVGPIVAYDYGDENGSYNPDEMVPFLGANMVIKKTIFNECGDFRVDLGPGVGTFGDDTEMFRRIEKANKKIYYLGKALVHHPVVPGRMTWKYIATWNMECGKYLVVKHLGALEENLVTIKGVPRYLYKRIVKHASLTLLSVFSQRKFIKHWIQTFRDIGMVKEYKRIHANEDN